jgi:tubulin--tyrosine ligase-like protein 12
LIDHAWTYGVNEARKQLREHEGLLNRMCNLMCIDQEDRETEEKVELVVETMWKYNQTYKLSTEKLTDEEREPLWYIMDEFGSSIRHNDKPTMQCGIFYYIPTKTMYSILYPLQDLTNGGIVFFLAKFVTFLGDSLNFIIFKMKSQEITCTVSKTKKFAEPK